MKKSLKISILVDNSDSWIVPFVRHIRDRLMKRCNIKLYFKASGVRKGDILLLLGCTSIIPPNILQRNKYNFIIHESALPKGRGWSPIAWQVLEGKNKIPIVLFEATEELDAGPIYLEDYIQLDGSELLPEIKQKQWEKTEELIIKLLEKWPNLKSVPQEGKPSYYRKRTGKDDKLDPQKSVIENFNHLRIVDNKKYPAWFQYKNQKYIVKIYKKI